MSWTKHCALAALALTVVMGGCSKSQTRPLDCAATESACGSTCTDTSSDPENCGACEVVCGAAEVCVEGLCSEGCPAGLSRCAEGCVDTQWDPDNCGGCGASCGGRVCEEGACVDICRPGLELCDERCADLLTDPENCGACGETCAIEHATSVCADGECRLEECAPGYGSCDGDPSTGCETELTANRENCGACGNSCARGLDCVDGACFSPGVLCGGVSCASGELCCKTGGMGGGGASCFDPEIQACSGDVQACDGAEDCGAGEVCCEADDSWETTCAESCTAGAIRCSASGQCPVETPYCCPWGGMNPSSYCSESAC